METTSAAVRRIEELRDSAEANQLATYVANVTTDNLTPAERKQLGLGDYEHQCIGWDNASMLPLERLRGLFKEDDWGDAWSLMDSEQTEYYEQDSGAIEAYTTVLAILTGDAAADGSPRDAAADGSPRDAS